MYLFICQWALFIAGITFFVFTFRKCMSYSRQFTELWIAINIWLPHRHKYSMISSKLTGTAFLKHRFIFCHLFIIWKHSMQPVVPYSNETSEYNYRFNMPSLAPMLLSFIIHMYVCIYICNIYKHCNHLDVLGMVIVKTTYPLCCTYLETRPKAQHGPQINNFSGKHVRCMWCV